MFETIRDTIIEAMLEDEDTRWRNVADDVAVYLRAGAPFDDAFDAALGEHFALVLHTTIEAAVAAHLIDQGYAPDPDNPETWRRRS